MGQCAVDVRLVRHGQRIDIEIRIADLVKAPDLCERQDRDIEGAFAVLVDLLRHFDQIGDLRNVRGMAAVEIADHRAVLAPGDQIVFIV